MRELLFSNRSAAALLAFQLLFFGGMWLSKMAHPLYFEEHSALPLFGISYATMALAGASTFFVGGFQDRWGPRGFIIAGSLLYALGLALRIYYTSTALAVLSGLLAGLGASVVLIGMRVWTFGVTTEESRPKVVGIRRVGQQIGTSAGTGAAGLALGVYGLTSGARGVLLVAAVLVAGAATLALLAPGRVHTKSTAGEHTEAEPPSKRPVALALAVAALGAIGGLYTSFVTPYLPLILRDRGMDVALVGLVIGAVGVVTGLVGPAFAARVKSERALRALVAAESVALVATVLLIPGWGVIVAVTALTLRAIGFASSATSEEVVQGRYFPIAHLGLLFGVSQGGFLTGDALGGLASGFVYDVHGASTALAVSAVLVATNCAAYPIFVAWRRRVQVGPDEQSADPASATQEANRP